MKWSKFTCRTVRGAHRLLRSPTFVVPPGMQLRACVRSQAPGTMNSARSWSQINTLQSHGVGARNPHRLSTSSVAGEGTSQLNNPKRTASGCLVVPVHPCCVELMCCTCSMLRPQTNCGDWCGRCGSAWIRTCSGQLLCRA